MKNKAKRTSHIFSCPSRSMFATFSFAYSSCRFIITAFIFVRRKKVEKDFTLSLKHAIHSRYIHRYSEEHKVVYSQAETSLFSIYLITIRWKEDEGWKKSIL